MIAFPAEVVQDRIDQMAWRVEKILGDGDGNMDSVIFYGINAQERAVEYADWKYGAINQPATSLIGALAS